MEVQVSIKMISKQISFMTQVDRLDMLEHKQTLNWKITVNKASTCSRVNRSVMN